MGTPDSLGIPESTSSETYILPFNDLDRATKLFEQSGNDIACVIIEPVAGNMNCVPPVAGYLQGLRELCTQHGAVLIFDEVMTGFRTALGGAQSVYGITPDLTTLGKVIGGGMPLAAITAPLRAKGKANTLCSNLIMRKVLRNELFIRCRACPRANS